jgi:hypothetical protein
MSRLLPRSHAEYRRCWEPSGRRLADPRVLHRVEIATSVDEQQNAVVRSGHHGLADKLAAFALGVVCEEDRRASASALADNGEPFDVTTKLVRAREVWSEAS